MHKRTLVAFSSKIFYKRLDDFKKEAQATGLFDNVVTFDESALSDEFIEYAKTHRRGFGFWRWKPMVITTVLETLDEDDILIYADVGCTFSTSDEAKETFDKWIKLVEQSERGILAFQMIYPEKHYNKAYTLSHFCAHDKQYTDTGQIAATIIVARKCAKSVEMLNKWTECAKHHPELFDDNMYELPRPLKDHRHDQSVFSLLCKLSGATTINWAQMNSDPKYPIIASRRKY